MFVRFKRVCEYKAPLDLIAYSASDWTHFAHLHRRSHLEFRLLAKEGAREIFLYKGRIIYPLPFHNTYLVFREYLPEQNGYHQYYLNVKTGAVHHLDHKALSEGAYSRIEGVFRFDVSRIWKLIPGVFRKLFALRMRTVMREDDDWVRERLRNGVYENSACASKVPERFNLIDDFIKNGAPPVEMSLEDHHRNELKR